MATATPAESPEAVLAGLARGATKALLATLRPPQAAPYASLVLTATALDGRPVLLLSRLAVHTRNIEADPRASLLLDGTGGARDPLTGPRATIEGRIEVSADPALRSRFLRRYPDAAAYAGFADFAVYVLVPERGHLVAGFGRIVDLGAAQIVRGDKLQAADWAQEPDAAAQLSRDTGRHIAGVDPDGVDVIDERGLTRFPFDIPAGTLADAMAQARAALQR